MARGQLRFDSDETPPPEDEIAKAARALGLYIEGDLAIDQDEFWLWPENEEPFGFWLSIQTQWNAGMDGRTGLNYPGVEACMRMRRIRPADRQQLFGFMQVMEQASLEEYAQKR